MLRARSHSPINTHLPQNFVLNLPIFLFPSPSLTRQAIENCPRLFIYSDLRVFLFPHKLEDQVYWSTQCLVGSYSLTHLSQLYISKTDMQPVFLSASTHILSWLSMIHIYFFFFFSSSVSCSIKGPSSKMAVYVNCRISTGELWTITWKLKPSSHATHLCSLVMFDLYPRCTTSILWRILVGLLNLMF